MNIIYRIVFESRFQRNEKPFYYIGSKSNCKFIEGKLFKGSKEYRGSSKYNGYHNLFETETYHVEVLEILDNHKELIKREYEVQKQHSVVESLDYFNLNYAIDNLFCASGYGTYKSVHNKNKVIRLPIDHPLVLSGEYVGVSKGNTLTEETRKKIGRSGKENPFYGKTHTEETKRKISEANSGLVRSEDFKQEVSKRFKGKPKSKEHRKKIGRNDLVMLKNKDTGECIRIPKEEKCLYDPNIWVNPYILSEKKNSIGSKWINDGKTNKKLKPGLPLPNGWEYGRLYQGWNDKNL
jgi:hypothetical protein